MSGSADDVVVRSASVGDAAAIAAIGIRGWRAAYPGSSQRRSYEATGWRPDRASRPLDFSGIPVDEMRYRRA